MSPQTAPARHDGAGPLRVGRYVVDRELARGAMGIVYHAHDPGLGRDVALKRLISDSPRLVQMFEREYHTLRSLRHPRIIEVFEYGVSEDGAYYTMELLDGADLRELAPLDFEKTCAYLRDVASSLGLLHARRMLHRDLSPRNVRVTGDDRAKLIDFGGLTSFGVPEIVVGTPPCIAPEALHRAALDQRTDLYALGAVAYWLLTGRHAYPAHELGELPSVWRTQPARPSEVVAARGLCLPQIPPELDALIMGLLTLNPLGRPGSAAEVIDRLEQIGGLPRDSDEAASRSYLLGVATLGRDRERERLRRRLTSAISGIGSAIVLEGQSGMGSTRLISELSVEAQLGGALPLVVDASVDRGAYGVVHGLIGKLLELMPGEARPAAEGHQAMLARFSPALQRALDEVADTTDFRAWPGELRKRTQAALSAWVLALAAQRPLLLAIDNAQRMDDGSATLLTTLAGAAPEHALLIVASTKPSEVESAPAAVRALRSMGASMVLRGLVQEDVHTLVRLLFGDVQNSSRLADWMHRLSGGNPRSCMELAAHLVDQQVVRYIQGAWVLPQDLSTAELPESVDALVAGRLERLPAEARALAEALAVHRGALPLQSCLALAQQLAIEAPHDALQLLIGERLLLVSGDSYRFSHDAVRQRVIADVSEPRRRELHRMIGALLAADKHDQDVSAMLDAGWHLLHGGEEERGAALLADAGLQLTYSGDELSTAVPALRAALGVFRRLNAPVAEQLRLLTPLAMAGYYSDRRLADEFGDEALLLYRRHLGIELAGRLRPLLGRHLSMYIAIGLTGARFLLRPALGGMPGLQRCITDFVACCMALTGVATICLDSETARRRASYLEPMAVFGKEHATYLAHRFATILAMIPEERHGEVIDGCSELLEALEHLAFIRDLPAEARKLLHGGVLYALASMDAFRARSNVLEYADRLERLGLKLYEMVADQLRASHHALRGEAQLADHYRARVEVHAVQAGSAWQAEVWAPSSMIIVNILTLDTIGQKRTVEQIDRQAQEIPSLRQHARMARAEYLMLKGEYEQGLAIAAPEIAATADRAFIGRSFTIASMARALNRLGRHAEAKALVEPPVLRLSEADKEVVAYYANLSRELAHAYSGLGDHERAFAIIDEMIERYASSEHPLLLGSLHATSAAVAVAAHDVARALEHLAHMENAFRPTANPALIVQLEHMRREVRRMVDTAQGRVPVPPAALDVLQSGIDEGSVPVRSLLSQCNGSSQRAQVALELLVKHVNGKRGFLFALQGGDLRLIAPQHGTEPPVELVENIRRQIAGDAGDDDVTVVSNGPARASLPPPVEPEPSSLAYRTFVLTTPVDGGARVVGAFAVEAATRTITPPEHGFLHAIASALFEAGDAGKTEIRTR